MKLKHSQNIFHVIVNANLMVQNEFPIILQNMSRVLRQ